MNLRALRTGLDRETGLGRTVQSVINPSCIYPRTAWSVEAAEGGVELVDRLAEEWQELCAENYRSEPFYRPEWVRTYLGTLAPPATKLLLITARYGDRLRAILPLVKERTFFCGLPVRKLRAATTWDCHRFDLVRGVGSHADAAVLEIWGYLKRLGGWDLIELPDVPEGGSAERILSAARTDGFAVSRWESARTPYVSIPPLNVGGDILAECDRRFAKDLRRVTRKLTSQGTLCLRRVEQADPKELQRFFRLESSGWKGKGGTAIACKPRNRAFYEEIARAAERFGYLSLYFLDFNGEAIAGHFGLTYQGRYFSPKVAYDERYKVYSPGHVIIEFILQDCRARGLSEYQILGQSAPWKSKWTSNVCPHTFLYVFRKGAYGRILCAAKSDVLPTLKRAFLRTRSKG